MSQHTRNPSPPQLRTMSSPRRPFRYFDLPGEIRNEIMSYILVPGDVYIRPPHRIAKHTASTIGVQVRETKVKLRMISRYLLASGQRLLHNIGSSNHQRSLSAGNAITTPRSALRFLSVCRQTRSEGSPVFYSMNTFHLPHGPIAITIKWLYSIHSDHCSHIRTVHVSFDERDITSATLEAFDKWRQPKAGHLLFPTHTILPFIHTHLQHFDDNLLATFLQTILWKEKWMVLRTWCTLDAIHFDCDKISQYQDVSWPPNGARADSDLIRDFISDLAELTALRVGSRIRAHGWRATRAWLLQSE